MTILLSQSSFFFRYKKKHLGCRDHFFGVCQSDTKTIEKGQANVVKSMKKIETANLQNEIARVKVDALNTNGLVKKRIKFWSQKTSTEVQKIRTTILSFENSQQFKNHVKFYSLFKLIVIFL